MSRYYPSRGMGRGRGGYSHGGGRGGYYEGGGGGGGRYYQNRDRRDFGGHGGMSSEARTQLEIAKKLVDTLMQSGPAGGGRRSGPDHYGAGQPPYKRPRDDSYDRDRSMSGRRYSDNYRGRDEYPDRRRHDEFRSPPARRGTISFRSRGYIPRRGTFGRGARRDTDFGTDRPRPKRDSFGARGDESRFRPGVGGKNFISLKCPHCRTRCVTFAEFRKHQLGREHTAAMRRVMLRIRTELTRMRLAQREEQKELEDKEAAKDPEAFEKLKAQNCGVCRLQYKEVDGVDHDESEWHKKQQAYQNPTCKTCNATFPSRIAYEKHIGTLTHIQKQTQQDRKESRDADFQKGGFMTLDSVGDVDDAGGEEAEDASGGRDADDDGQPKQTAAETLAQLGEYDGKHAVGSNHMRRTEVYHCALCDIYIKITAKINAVLIKHCMGKKHFENYRKNLVKRAEKEAEEAAARAKEEAEADEDEDKEEEDGETEKANGGEGRTTDDAAWEQMDDNFLLGDDQEEEAGDKQEAAE